MNGLDDKERPKTATWQELFKCACLSSCCYCRANGPLVSFVSLQSSIADTRASLQEIVKNLDGLLERDEMLSPVRSDLTIAIDTFHYHCCSAARSFGT